MPGFRFFYGLEPRWLRSDRLFKVFSLPDGICGVYLAGQVYDELSGHLQLVAPADLFGPLLTFWVRRLVRHRQQREARYEDLTPGSPEFLSVDVRNFIIERNEVESVTIKSWRCLWTGGYPNVGRVDLTLCGGQRRRLILIGEQSVQVVGGLLKESFGIVEILER